MIKTRIILNDMEGLKIPKFVLERIKSLFAKNTQNSLLEQNKSSGLDSFLNVAESYQYSRLGL